jgi:SAM-dependent methyltransferase
METCYICQDRSPREAHEIHDTVDGTHSFRYERCPSCGVLQLEKIPENIDYFYSQGYYSFTQQNPLVSYLKSLRTAYYLRKPTLVNRLLAKKYGPPPVVRWLEPIPVPSGASVLDVGCGQGIALRDLSRAGFSRLVGVDPYLSESVTYGPVQLIKSQLRDIKESFDIVILSHSLEHMQDPREILKQVRARLSPGGHVVLRVPILGYSWQHYGRNWIDLDAPRHNFIFTPKSVELLAAQAGLALEKTVYDMEGFNLWASEQLAQGILPNSPRSYAVNPRNSIFSEDDMQKFDRLALELNVAGQADQASFYLKPITLSS